MDTDKLKKEFAAQLLRNDGDGFKAAFAVCGSDTGLALQIGREWPKDTAVLAEQARLLTTSDAKTFLPSKEQQARDVYAMATDQLKAIEDRLKAHRLYAEIMGHIEKPSAGAGINILTQGVMVVRDAGSDADWQAKALTQQRKLTDNAVN